MVINNSQIQVVSFSLGDELYGINIMDVKELVKKENIRPLPGLPYFVEGIINLRGEIIPIVSLHKRFNLKDSPVQEEDEFAGGFIILNGVNMKLGVIIDKISRVVTIQTGDIKPPPQMLTGIGREYIYGIVNNDSEYLIILDTDKLFTHTELSRLSEANLQ